MEHDLAGLSCWKLRQPQSLSTILRSLSCQHTQPELSADVGAFHDESKVMMIMAMMMMMMMKSFIVSCSSLAMIIRISLQSRLSMVYNRM
jgi:hypothetical protein